MNYVQHTRAAHQHLAGQPAATPHHVSLYWALFYEWNAARFPDSLPLDHAALMRTAHIGNEKTYRAALRDLDSWQMLTYHPSHTRYQPSTCCLADLSAEPFMGAKIAPHEAPTSGAEATPMPVIKGKTAHAASSASEPQMPEPVRPEMPPMLPASGPQVPEHSLYDKTSGSKLSTSKPTPFGRSNAPHSGKKIGEKGQADEGLSGEEVVSEESTPPMSPPAGSRRQRGPGAHAATIREAAVAGITPQSGRQPRPEIPFAESELADVEVFIRAFEGTDYALADLRFYHEKVRLWRDKKTGEQPRRRDWLATAQRFMINDAHDNRLKLAPTSPNGPAAGPDGQQPGSTIDALYDQFYPRRAG